MIRLKDGLCVQCNDDKLRPVIGKKEKALCVNHYNSRWRANAKPIEDKSDSRILEDKIYTPVRLIFLKDNPFCAAKLEYCSGRPDTVHHTKGHNQYYLDVETWLPVCLSCHRWLELNPVKAKELGLSQDRLTTTKIVLPFNIKCENSLHKLRKLQST